MVRELQWMKWLQVMLLALVVTAGTQQVRAQMSGNFNADVAVVSAALAATVAATGKADAEASRLTMEELYRQWRTFRAKNFETQSADPRFVPDMESVEAKLFAASKRVDDGQFAEARDELQAAAVLLQAARQRHGAATPAAY